MSKVLSGELSCPCDRSCFSLLYIIQSFKMNRDICYKQITELEQKHKYL